MRKYNFLFKDNVHKVIVCAFAFALILFSCIFVGYAASGKLSLTIPGVSAIKDRKEYTVFESYMNGNTSYTMVPQGVCFAKNYVIFTGYDSSDIRPSVMWIRNANTNELLATVELPDKEHVGAVCFDGTFLWIPTKDNTVRFIRLSDIEKQIQNGYKVFNFTYANDDRRGICVNISIENGELKTGTNRSIATIAYYNGFLYTAEFNGGDIYNPKPKLTKFSVSLSKNKPASLTKLTVDELPDYVQGVQFFRKNSTDYVILSRSYGRKANSIASIDVCKLSDFKSIIKSKNLSTNSEYLMIEGIAVQDSYLYAITESAAWKYKQGADGGGKSPNPCDYVYSVSLNDIS